MDQPDPNSLTMWVACAAVALVVLDRVFRFYKEHIREQPRPSETYATIAQHNDLRRVVSDSLGQIDDRFQSFDSKLQQVIRETETRRSQNVARLHEKIDTSNETLRKEIKGDVHGIHKRFDDLVPVVCEMRGWLEANRKS